MLFLLPVGVKYWIENNSTELVGRKIQIEKIQINYLKAAVKIKGFTLYEKDDEQVFVSFQLLNVNFEPIRLLKKEYVFSEIKLIAPYLNVVQGESSFNFEDMIPPADTLSESENTDTTALRLAVYNFVLEKGKICYTNPKMQHPLRIENLNFVLPGFSFDSEQADADLAFQIGQTGRVNVNALVDNVANKVLAEVDVRDVDFKPFTGFVHDFVEIETFAGWFSSNITIEAKIDNFADLKAAGTVAVDSFEITDTSGLTVLGFERFEMVASEIDVAQSYFHLSSVLLKNPMSGFQRYPSSTNIENMLRLENEPDTVVYENVGDAETIDTVARRSIAFQLDSFRMENGTVFFADHALNRPFEYQLDSMNVWMASFSDTSTRIPAGISFITPGNGRISANALLNIQNPFDLSIRMNLKNLNMLSFSPYSEYYLAMPIVRGIFNYDFELDMDSLSLKNNNVIGINNIEMGQKTGDTTAVKVPVKLALYVLKDRHGMISINMPVEGNPSDPGFSFGKILWQTFSNLMIKTAAAPLNALAGVVGVSPDRIKEIDFQYGQSYPDAGQEDKLEKISQIMKRNKDLKFRFVQFTNVQREKEFMAVEYALEQYRKICEAMPDTIPDKPDCDRLTADNPLFVRYVWKQVGRVDSIRVVEASVRWYGDEHLALDFDSLMQHRNKLLDSWLADSLQINRGQYEISIADLKNLPDELKYPHFKVEVSVQ